MKNRRTASYLSFLIMLSSILSCISPIYAYAGSRLTVVEGSGEAPNVEVIRIDEDGNEIGTLDAVMQTGANDVYSIIRPDKSELLIPAIRDCIIDVSPEKGTITVRLLPGL